MTITANASETNGSISTVFFYNGGALLGSSSTYPYSLTVNNLSGGTYVLTAMAVDAMSNSTTSSAVTVTVSSNAPVVAISSPADGSTSLYGSYVSLTASASEVNGSIAQVSYYYNGNLIGTSSGAPYKVYAMFQSMGSYTITAVATDTTGGSTTSSPVTITVSNRRR